MMKGIGIVLAFCGMALALGGEVRGGQGGVPRELVEKFRKVRGLTAEFREEKKMAILVAPMVRAGTIAYEAPGRLAQAVTSPNPSRLVLAGNVLTMVDGGQRHVLDIDKQPAVGLLVRLLLGVLAGDVAALERHAHVVYKALPAPSRSTRANRATAPATATTPGWSLDLTPRDPLLAKLIKSMSLTGRDAVIDVLTVVDANGDQTVTKFSNVKFLSGFTPPERAARFGVAP
jgi:hypothetical protein